MRKKKIEARYLFLILLLLITIFLALFLYTVDDNRKLNPVEIIIKDTITTTQKIIYFPIKFVIQKVDYFRNLKDITKKYNELKNKEEQINLINAENTELKRTIKSLKEELKIDYVLTEYEYLNATIINRNVAYWYNTITIDKGTYNGVSVDMVVINNKGLIGKVIKTTNFTSEIKLITSSDLNNKISVSVVHNEVKHNGLISGYDYQDNKLEIDGISGHEEISNGDIVYTSGLGGIFPSGILIGTAVSFDTDNYDLAKIIKVEPSVNFNDLNFVTVLKRKDQAK